MGPTCVHTELFRRPHEVESLLRSPDGILDDLLLQRIPSLHAPANNDTEKQEGCAEDTSELIAEVAIGPEIHFAFEIPAKS